MILLRCASQSSIVCVMETPTETNPPLSGSVASEIRAEIARQGITQSIIADRLHVGPMWVSRRINPDRRVPLDLDDLERIAGALGIPVASLLERAAQTNAVSA